MKHRATDDRPRVKGKAALLFLAAASLLSLGAIALLASTAASPTRNITELEPLVAAKVALVDRNLERAESLLRDALRVDPTHKETRLLLGRVLVERGRPTQARDILAALLREDPTNSETLRTLASACQRVGQWDLAAVYLGQATQIRKTDASLWRELGLTQKQTGDSFAALSSLQHSLSLEADQGDVSTLISELVQAAPRSPGDPGSRPLAIDPMNPRPIDPQSLVPRPKAPDPSQHFARPSGRPQ